LKQIVVKTNAPEILRQELKKARQDAAPGFSFATDPYIPLEAITD
jgi:DNA repair photolyase